jgi:hypothetical protein
MMRGQGGMKKATGWSPFSWSIASNVQAAIRIASFKPDALPRAFPVRRRVCKANMGSHRNSFSDADLSGLASRFISDDNVVMPTC